MIYHTMNLVCMSSFYLEKDKNMRAVFVKNLADDVDPYKEDRKEINALVNEDMEGNFSEKILKIMGIKM